MILGTSHQVERESFEAHDINQLLLWQRLPLRDTTLELHRNGQNNSPVVLSSTVHKGSRRGQTRSDHGDRTQKYCNWTTGVERSSREDGRQWVDSTECRSDVGQKALINHQPPNAFAATPASANLYGGQLQDDLRVVVQQQTSKSLS